MRLMIQELKELMQWAEFTVRHTAGHNLFITAKTADDSIAVKVIYDSHEHTYTVKTRVPEQPDGVWEGIKSNDVISTIKQTLFCQA